MFVPKDNSLGLELCEIMYLNLYFFFFFYFFEVDKSGAITPTYPPSKSKSDLRSSFKRGESSDSFYLEGGHIRRWTLKRFCLFHFYFHVCFLVGSFLFLFIILDYLSLPLLLSRFLVDCSAFTLNSPTCLHRGVRKIESS